MAIAFRASSASAPSADGAAVTAAVPSGTLTGDVMLMTVRALSVSVSATLTGWTPITSANYNGDARTWWRAASSEPSGYSITGSGIKSVTIDSYSGVNTVSPIRAFNTATGNPGTSPVPGSLAGIQATDMAHIAYTVAGSDVGLAWGAPSGWTIRGATSGFGNTAQIRSYDKLGGSDRPTNTNSGPAAYWVVLSVALVAGAVAADQGGFFF